MLSDFLKRNQEEKRVKEEGRLPPGQSVTQKFPVLHYGPVPTIDLATWKLSVFGDVEQASNGAVNGVPILARFGKYGVIGNRRGQLQSRLSLRNLNVTPNHHELAKRFAFSDNFYADSEVSVDGHHWLAGSYPNAWTESTLMAAYGGQKD